MRYDVVMKKKAGFLKGSFLKELLITTLVVFMCSSIVSFILYNHYYSTEMTETYEDKIRNDSDLVFAMIQNQIRELQIHANTTSTGSYAILRISDTIRNSNRT